MLKLKSYELIPDVYTRYKDDIEVAMESLDKGSKLDDDKIVIDEEKLVRFSNRTCKS